MLGLLAIIDIVLTISYVLKVGEEDNKAKKIQNKILYYYNIKMPDKLNKVEVIDILYLTGKNIKSIQYVVIRYDIENCTKSMTNRWLELSSPYEDEEIFAYEGQFFRFEASFNKEKITKRFEEKRKQKINELERNLRMLKGDD